MIERFHGKIFKFIGIIFISLSLLSCFYKQNLTYQEKARKMVSQKEMKYKRINPNEKNIKTNLLYKSLDYYYDEGENQIRYFKDNSLKPDFIDYIRFYNTGTILSYSKKRDDTIFDKVAFDSKNAAIGFILDKKDNVILDYDPQYGGRFLEREYEVKADTLILKYGDNSGYRVFYYFQEFEVPTEIIEIPEF
jgi:hypothetical protein